MKQLVLVAALSALASSALTLLVFSAFRPAPAPAGPGLSTVDFKAALADLEREVAALRREMSERAVAAPAVREPFPGAPEAGASPATAAGVDGAPAGPVHAETGPRDEANRLERFRALFPRDEDGARDYSQERKNLHKWLFRSEREVLEWFGVPARVSGSEGGGEVWYYEIPTGEMDEEGNLLTGDYWVRLSRGRVIEIGD